MTKYAGFLGFLKRNTTGSTYATVGQLLTVGEVGFDRNLIDVSAHGDLVADFIAGRLEGKEVDLVLLWDPADSQHQALLTDFSAATQTVRNYELQHPSWTTAYRFPAIFMNWGVEMTDDGGAEGHMTMKITGAVTPVTPS
jgi:hypothetical protein